jgi:hypothetical protein
VLDDERKPIAFTCHAGLGSGLGEDHQGSAGNQRDGIHDDIVNAGANCVNQATVVDGHLDLRRDLGRSRTVDESAVAGTRRQPSAQALSHR